MRITYDTVGNRTALHHGAVTTQYRYDALVQRPSLTGWPPARGSGPAIGLPARPPDRAEEQLVLAQDQPALGQDQHHFQIGAEEKPPTSPGVAAAGPGCHRRSPSG